MSFNPDKFGPVDGGGLGAPLYTYYTTDALATGVVGTAVANGYFRNLYANFPATPVGAIIMAYNGSTPAVTVFAVTGNDANGVTVVPSSGLF